MTKKQAVALLDTLYLVSIRNEDGHMWLIENFGTSIFPNNFISFKGRLLVLEDNALNTYIIDEDSQWDYVRDGFQKVAYLFKKDTDAIEFKLRFG